MEKTLYRYTTMEYVNAKVANRKQTTLRYGFLPYEGTMTIVNTTDFNEFYDETLMPTNTTLFGRKFVITPGGTKRFTARNFESYQRFSHYDKYSLSDFDLNYLQKHLPADEYFELYNEMTAKH